MVTTLAEPLLPSSNSTKRGYQFSCPPCNVSLRWRKAVSIILGVTSVLSFVARIDGFGDEPLGIDNTADVPYWTIIFGGTLFFTLLSIWWSLLISPSTTSFKSSPQDNLIVDEHSDSDSDDTRDDTLSGLVSSSPSRTPTST